MKRINRPKIRKFRIIRIYLLVFLAILATIGAYIAIEHSLEPILSNIAHIRAKEVIAETINEAVTEVISESENEDFLKIDKDESGYISAISANTLYMNKFSSKITSLIHKKLKNLKEEQIIIPIGSILGSNILSQTGPSVNLKIKSIGNASISFSTEFESAGINQTKYKVYMKVTGKVQPIIPFVTDTYEISETIPVAETVIVGNVPDTFLSLPSESN